MKEIEIIDQKSDFIDTELGYYKILKDGPDDVVIVKKLKCRQIEKNNDLTLSDTVNYKITTQSSLCHYVVGPLDNLTKIANKTNTDEEYLVKTNNLKSKKLFIGQIIKY